MSRTLTEDKIEDPDFRIDNLATLEPALDTKIDDGVASKTTSQKKKITGMRMPQAIRNPLPSIPKMLIQKIQMPLKIQSIPTLKIKSPSNRKILKLNY